MPATTTSKLQWEWGTAYDMFISLEVLHSPSEFGVRGAWASSVRKRLPSPERTILDLGRHLFHIPFHWIHALPAPKDAITVLYTLQQIPAADRLCTLAFCEGKNEFSEMLKNISVRGSWTEDDFSAYQNMFLEKEGKKPMAREKLESILNAWAQAEEFGKKYFEALQTYQEVFFAEEEKRIRPALKDALVRAQTMAEKS